MKLLSLKIKNFKGISGITIEPNGRDIDILAANGLGKTTIMDAFQWLMVDKDSLGKSDFEIKPHDSIGKGINVEVEAVLSAPDVTLKKVYYEKFTKKRGSASTEFTGHTTDYFVDGVPVQKKEYTDRVDTIADGTTMRMLTDPRYFNEILEWQKRRSILLEMCGDVSDKDVIDSSEELSPLPEIIGTRTMAEYRKIAESRRREINEELKAIPIRIDEANESIIKPEKSVSTAKTLIKSHKEKLDAKTSELNRLENNTEATAKEKELNQAESDILKAQNAHQKKINEALESKRQVMNKAQQELDEATGDHNKTLVEIDRLEKSITSDESKLPPLREKWTAIDSEEFDPPETPGNCPTCGQVIPVSKIESANNKALEIFNLDKSNRLSTINTQGKEIKSNIANAKFELEKLIKKSSGEDNLLVTLTASFEKAKAAYDDTNEKPQSIIDLESKRDEIKAEIQSLENSSAPKINVIKDYIDQIHERINELNVDILQHEHNKTTEKRIQDLLTREKEIAGEFETIERNIYLIEQFTRAKVAMLDDRINSRFSTVRFRLTEEQINGGLKDVCIVTSPAGVGYWSMNNAARIQAGAEIIRAAQEHYGIQLPVWFDNRESVIDIPDMGCQVFSLYVDPIKDNLEINYQ